MWCIDAILAPLQELFLGSPDPRTFSSCFCKSATSDLSLADPESAVEGPDAAAVPMLDISGSRKASFSKHTLSRSTPGSQRNTSRRANPKLAARQAGIRCCMSGEAHENDKVRMSKSRQDLPEILSSLAMPSEAHPP